MPPKEGQASQPKNRSFVATSSSVSGSDIDAELAELAGWNSGADGEGEDDSELETGGQKAAALVVARRAILKPKNRKRV